MNSVTGPRLAATLARRGGLGVLPQDLPLQELGAAIRWVKQQPVAWDTPVVLSPEQTVAEALRQLPPAEGHGIVLRSASGEELGAIPASRLGTALPRRAARRPGARLDHGARRRRPRRAARRIRPAGRRRPRLRAGAASRSRGRHASAAAAPCAARCTGRRSTRGGRLRVAAAVGINGDVASKAPALANEGVDVLVLDTAHGHQEGMLRALATVKKLGLGIPIVAGNIVTAEGVRDLVDAGADILKVGVGPGAMCTTRMMTAVGRPQFGAVLETAEAARELGAHVWADGGVRYPRDVALALAAGAASVMIGSWFAGTIEAPGVAGDG